MLDQPLDGPCRRVTKGADRVTFNLFCNIMQNINFRSISITTDQAIHHPVHPARAFTARGALTAGFMLVEI